MEFFRPISLIDQNQLDLDVVVVSTQSGRMEDSFKKVKEVSQKLCAEFNTISKERKTWSHGGEVHQSTGEYVTKSSIGFFISPNVPAYKICTLFSALIELYTSKSKHIIKLINQRFEEALWEGFLNPTDSKGLRKKKNNFCELRKDVKRTDFNNFLADVYEEAVTLVQKSRQSNDKISEQVFD